MDGPTTSSERTSLLPKPPAESLDSTESSFSQSYQNSNSSESSTASSESTPLVVPMGSAPGSQVVKISSSNDNDNNNISNSNKSGNTGRNRNPTNHSTNILMLYRLQEMQASATCNLWLAFLCLIYLGTNITLVCVNYVNFRFVEAHPDLPEDAEPVDDTVYHLVEFWATFFFAIVECLALANTPKSLYSMIGGGSNQSKGLNPLFLRMVLCFNIVATAVPAVMVSFSIETFEIVSHEIEYINELTMSFIDVILLVSLWKSRTPQPKQRRKDPSSVSCGKLGGGTGGGEDNLSGWATSGIAMLVAVVQLGVYNGMGRTPDGDMVGEVPGHFLEFSFEIISSLIAFWFCMDNKYVADKEIGLILYGADHDLDCQICEAKAGEFALEHSGAGVGVAAGTEECVPCTTQYQTV